MRNSTTTDNLFREAWTLQRLELFDAAIKKYEEVLRIDPTHLPSWTNLGGTLAHIGMRIRAKECARTAIELAPEDAKVVFNYGTMLSEDMELAEAARRYRTATVLNPDFADAHWNLAHTLLALEQYEEGWEEYEWGWTGGMRTPVLHSDVPRWNGESLAGKRILLWSEQGFGDTIQFLRYVIPVVNMATGSGVTVEVPSELYRLAKVMLYDCLVVVRHSTDYDMSKFDFQCPLMSLPRALFRAHRELDREKAERYLNPRKFSGSSYITCKPGLLKLSSKPDSILVGLQWSGSPNHPRDRERSISYEQAYSLVRANTLCVSLQKERISDELKGAIADLSGYVHDFMDVAQIITQLDLVVTVDTAAAHLAGALGVPTLLMLPFESDWRWGIEKTTPWYNSVIPIRQSRDRCWEPVLEQVRAAIDQSVKHILDKRKRESQPT